MYSAACSYCPILTSPSHNISYSASVLADARVSDGPSLLLLTNQRLLLAHVDARGHTCVKWLAWELPQSVQAASTFAMSTAAPELDMFRHPFLSSRACRDIDWYLIAPSLASSHWFFRMAESSAGWIRHLSLDASMTTSLGEFALSID